MRIILTGKKRTQTYAIVIDSQNGYNNVVLAVPKYTLERIKTNGDKE